MRESISVGKLAKPKIKLLLDSGAFSAWKRCIEINLSEYIAYIKKHEHLLESYVCLDVIPGKPGQVPKPSEVEAAAQASYKNQQAMKKAGLTPIPVFHYGESFKWLERYLKDDEPYIGLGGMGNPSTQQQIQWLDQVFTRITDKDGWPIVKTHGFGVASFDLLKMYPWHCMTEEHEVLTRRGWKRLGQFSVGDEAICFNDGTAQWDQIQEIPVFSVKKAPIHKLDYRTFSARVTGNHRWRVWHRNRWNWVTTEELRRWHKVARAPDSYTGPSKTISDDQVALMAWFWTEGSIKRRKKYKKDSVQIYQSASANPGKVRRIRKMLARLGEKYCETTDNRCGPTGKPSEMICFELYGNARDWLLENSPDKHLSWKFLWSMTEEQVKLFVKISVMADGWIDPERPGFYWLSQARPQSIDIFRTACLLAGDATSQTFFQRGEQKTYTISKSPVKWATPVNDRATHEIEKFTGNIWCIRVPTGAFFTRCNGKIYVTGNTCDATSWALTAAYGSIYVPVFKGDAPDYSQPPAKFTVSLAERKGAETPSDHYTRFGPIVKKRVEKYLEEEVGVSVVDAAKDYEVRARAIVHFMLAFERAIGSQPFKRSGAGAFF